MWWCSVFSDSSLCMHIYLNYINFNRMLAIRMEKPEDGRLTFHLRNFFVLVLFSILISLGWSTSKFFSVVLGVELHAPFGNSHFPWLIGVTLMIIILPLHFLLRSDSLKETHFPYLVSEMNHDKDFIFSLPLYSHLPYQLWLHLDKVKW